MGVVGMGAGVCGEKTGCDQQKMLSSISSSRMMELKQDDSLLLFSVSQRWIEAVSYNTGFRLNTLSSFLMWGSLLLSPTSTVLTQLAAMPCTPFCSCCTFNFVLSLGSGGLDVGAMFASDRGGSFSNPNTMLEKSTCESSLLKIGLRSLSRDFVRETFMVFWWWYFRICTCASSLSIRSTNSPGMQGEGLVRRCCSAMRRTSLRRSVMFLSMDFILDSIYTFMSQKIMSISLWTIQRMYYSCLKREEPPVEAALEYLPDIIQIQRNRVQQSHREGNWNGQTIYG